MSARWSGALVLVLAAAGALYGAHRALDLRARLDASESARARAASHERLLADALLTCEAERDAALARAPSEASPARAGPELAAQPEVPAPAAPPESRPEPERGPDARVRDVLARRVAAWDDGGEMDDATRTAVVDLLLRIRALRAVADSGPEDETPPGMREALADAQYEFIDLTGMGVAEFLGEIEAPQPVRPRRPEEAAGPIEGEERKRFSDEVSRQLGIATPGSVETLEEDEWTSE